MIVVWFFVDSPQADEQMESVWMGGLDDKCNRWDAAFMRLSTNVGEETNAPNNLPHRNMHTM